MKKLRYGSMALAIVVGVGAFLGAQRLDLIPGPWSKKKAFYQNEYKGGAQAISSYSAEIDANPDDYMNYYRRGTQFQKQRQYDRALADFDAAVRLSPTPLSLEALGERAGDTTHAPTRTLNLVVLVRSARAEVLQQLNRPEEALADLDQVVALDARKTDALFERGQLRMIVGRFDDAISDFDQLLAARSDTNWYFARGLTKYMKSDWSSAAADFRAAVERAPREEAYLVWLAKAQLRSGQPLQAQQFATLDLNGNARYVIEAFLSDHDAAQFIAGARAAAAYAGRNRNARCETTLFLGEWLMLRKKDGAHAMFNEALQICRPLSVERAIAAAELQRLSP